MKMKKTEFNKFFPFKNDYRKFRYLFIFCFMILITLIVLRPKLGIEKIYQSESDSTIGIILVLDRTLSMTADDVNPSRFNKAQEIIKEIVEKIPAQYTLISFVGKASVTVPLTVDRGAIVEIAENLLPVYSSYATGSNIYSALEQADEYLKNIKRKEQKIKKWYVILLTDGEIIGFEKKKYRFKNKPELIVVGIGTKSGGTVFYDLNGKVSLNVISRLDETYLQELAKLNQGKYFNLNSEKEIINYLEKSIEKNFFADQKGKRYQTVVYNEIYPYFSFFAMIAFLILHYKLYTILS